MGIISDIYSVNISKTSDAAYSMGVSNICEDKSVSVVQNLLPPSNDCINKINDHDTKNSAVPLFKKNNSTNEILKTTKYKSYPSSFASSVKNITLKNQTLQLPHEILLNIFEHLPNQTLRHCTVTQKSWTASANEILFSRPSPKSRTSLRSLFATWLAHPVYIQPLRSLTLAHLRISIPQEDFDKLCSCIASVSFPLLLKILDLRNARGLCDSHLVGLVSCCHRTLSELKLSYSPMITDSALIEVARLCGLQNSSSSNFQGNFNRISNYYYETHEYREAKMNVQIILLVV